MAGSAGAAVIMFLKRKPTPGIILTGVSLAILASEYPDKFAEFRQRLPECIERGNALLDVVSRVGERLAEVAERRGSAWYESLLRT
jgi:hypothetical protein